MENQWAMERSVDTQQAPHIQVQPRNRKKAFAAAAPYMLIFPAVAILIVFEIYPMLMAFLLSQTDWNLISPEWRWVGLTNYTKLLGDPKFWSVVGNTFVFGLFSVGLTVSLATAVAVALDEKLKGVKLFRTFVFLPYIMPMVAIGTLWVWVFNQNFGLANWFLGLFAIPPAPWLAKPGWAMAALVIVKVWKVTGYYMVILLAGKQNIPEALYEAARIDGAGRMRLFRHLTLPLLSPYVVFVLIVALIGAFEDFDLIYSMTRGGPADSTDMLIFYIYQHGFEFFETGFASSAAVALFVVMMGITLLQMAVSRRWVHYQ